MTHPRFACLIPAHDEASRIGAVLAAVVGHPLIDQVLVIDDGSRDGTAAVAQAAGAEVMRLDPNRGKTRALAEGIARVDADYLVLIDADLIGLTAPDVTALIEPVAQCRAGATLSLRGNAPRTWRAIGVDYISGERVIPRALIAPYLHHLHGLPRFGFEVFLNERLAEARIPVAIVDWHRVSSPAKSVKRGRWRGGLADLRMIIDILRTVGPRQIARQITYLRQGRPRDVAQRAGR
ncbi:glycosyltransferase family 2 protein [Paracoccus sp. p4-l81]|uniref:glycosyltransferase family 2 protein n=1 Tax=unclassified Paracoccus (in: a-proteobacteria) TaxID=2688777 RepID=UPI0035B75CB0